MKYTRLAKCLLPFTLPAYLGAQEPASYQDEPIVLEPVTVRSTPFLAPQTASSPVRISRVDLRRESYRTTPQALREVPGVLVQETSQGQGSPILRGFTGPLNLFLIDGIRLNNSVFRSGPNQYWNTVDPFSLDSLEVQKGVNASRFGSDAIGGTVQALTQAAFFTNGQPASGEAIYRVASAENSHVGRLGGAVRLTDNLAIRGGGTLKHFGDLRAGRGTGLQPNTGYDEWDADFKLQYKYQKDGLLTLAYQQVQQDNVPRTHSTVYSRSFSGTSVGSELQRELDQRRQLTYLQLAQENPVEGLDLLKVSLSWHSQGEDRHRERTGGRVDDQGFLVNTLGFWTELESDTSLGKLQYGLDYYHDQVDSFSSSNPIQGPVADDATYDLLGVYLRDQIQLAERWEVTIGGRYNYAAVDAGSVRDPLTTTRFSFSKAWHSVVGDLQLSWDVKPENIRWFAGVAEGFRAPNISDLTRFDTARSGEVETAAPGLKPEHYLGLENGVEFQYSKFQCSVQGFYTLVRDQIVRVPTGTLLGGLPEVTKDNVGDGWVRGVEVGVSYRLSPEWVVFGDWTYMEGKVDTFPTSAPVIRREYIDRLMPTTGRIGLRWEETHARIWSEILAVAAARADRTSTRDNADTQRIPPGGTPGYAVLHFRAGGKIGERMEWAASVENVLDRNYRIHGSGQNMPGRNIMLEWTIRF